MSWKEYHTISERDSADAEVALREGNSSKALELYYKAAESELKALQSLGPDKGRTLGITLISAVSLFYKAKRYDRAESLACQYLSTSHLPPFSTTEIRTLLQTIWSDQVRAESSVRFTPGQVFVSVKGGEVVPGGAPLDLVVQKVESIQSLYYRTTEFLNGLPHRKRGGASLEIQQTCRPWLFQAPHGSYQFAVAVQEPPQQELFAKSKISVQEISSTFFSILRASVDDPDVALPNLVPDPQYRGTFMKLARNLAPSGKVFEELEIRSAGQAKPITILPTTRKSIGDALRRQFPRTKQVEEKEETISGVLRALDLDHDWLEVTVANVHIRIFEVGETVDDLIGPMVNRLVIIQALRKTNGQLALVDIQAGE
jgi:hypothetical protein